MLVQILSFLHSAALTFVCPRGHLPSSRHQYLTLLPKISILPPLEPKLFWKYKPTVSHHFWNPCLCLSISLRIKKKNVNTAHISPLRSCLWCGFSLHLELLSILRNCNNAINLYSVDQCCSYHLCINFFPKLFDSKGQDTSYIVSGIY